MRRTLAVLACVVTALAITTSASAHDYWLTTLALHVAPGDAVPVRMFVGEHFEHPEVEERPYARDRATRFVHVSRAGNEDLAARATDAARPIIALAPVVAGGHMIAMDRSAVRIELEASAFDGYLLHEGLGHIRDERARRDEASLPGRERYSRCLKLYVHAGDTSDDVWSRVLGQTLEVVPSSDPARLRAGDQLRVIILLRGAPLAGASVGVWSRDAAGAHTRELRSDSRGEVTIDVDRAGDWAVRLVHMERCRVDCAAVEWESTWASFVFGVRAGRAEGAPPREVGRAR